MDLLYSQIPPAFLKNIIGEFDARAGISAASSDIKDDRLARLVAKLNLVETFLQQADLIGDADNPKSYFNGTHPMYWGVRNRGELEFVFFGGGTLKTVVGLGGSCRHLQRISDE